MAKTSTKHRNILIASLIVVVLVVSSIGAVIYLLTKDNVKVSGKAVFNKIMLTKYSQTFLTKSLQEYGQRCYLQVASIEKKQVKHLFAGALVDS